MSNLLASIGNIRMIISQIQAGMRIIPTDFQSQTGLCAKLSISTFYNEAYKLRVSAADKLQMLLFVHLNL